MTTAIHIRWSDDGQHIRKWAREPFEGSTAFVASDQMDARAAFGAAMFELLWDSFTDGGWEIEINDLITVQAVKAGLVRETVFDPDEHTDPDGACEAGDPYYQITAEGRDTLRAAREAASSAK